MPGTSATYYGTELPPCDFCTMAGTKKPASYDGATHHGPWAYMCVRHFHEYGVGLGTGNGQRLTLEKPTDADQ